MSLSSAIRSAYRAFRSSLATPDEWLVKALGGGKTWTGETVSEYEALQIPAVLSCVRVLSETGAGMPLFVYRRTANGGREKAGDHPVYRLIHDEPNPEQTPFEFKEMMIGHVCLWGNFYAQLIMDGKGIVRQMWPLRPDWMTVKRPTADGPKVYEYRREDGSQRMFMEDEILHVAGLTSTRDPLKGLSPVAWQRECLGWDRAAHKFSSKLFANGVKPSGILQVPGRLRAASEANLSKSFNDEYSKAENAHKAIILEEGVKWVQTTIPPNDAQFLETIKFSRSEIAGWYRVPLHLIGDLERATFSNIEHQDLGLAKHTMRPWCARIEQRMTKSLLGSRERSTYFVEFSMNELMRGDAKSRSEFYGAGIRDGYLKVNEVRAWENLNAVPGGDVLARPLNTAWVDEQGNLIMPLAQEKVQ